MRSRTNGSVPGEASYVKSENSEPDEQVNRVDLLSSKEVQRPLRPMPSLIDLGELPVDRSQYHVGEGFMEIGGFVMLIGQSYAGKSTLITQISLNMAIGRTWLFFKVERPLKILIVRLKIHETN